MAFSRSHLRLKLCSVPRALKSSLEARAGSPGASLHLTLEGAMPALMNSLSGAAHLHAFISITLQSPCRSGKEGVLKQKTSKEQSLPPLMGFTRAFTILAAPGHMSPSTCD